MFLGGGVFLGGCVFVHTWFVHATVFCCDRCCGRGGAAHAWIHRRMGCSWCSRVCVACVAQCTRGDRGMCSHTRSATRPCLMRHVCEVCALPPFAHAWTPAHCMLRRCRRVKRLTSGRRPGFYHGITGCISYVNPELRVSFCSSAQKPIFPTVKAPLQWLMTFPVFAQQTHTHTYLPAPTFPHGTHAPAKGGALSRCWRAIRCPAG